MSDFMNQELVDEIEYTKELLKIILIKNIPTTTYIYFFILNICFILIKLFKIFILTIMR